MLTAQFMGTSMLSATVPIRVRRRLDVPAGSTWYVPAGSVFSGGDVDGTVVAYRPLESESEWRLEIESASVLDIANSGAIVARGGAGSSLGHGGLGGHGAGGGGASTLTGGASGGFGDPNGDDTADDMATTRGGLILERRSAASLS